MVRKQIDWKNDPYILKKQREMTAAMERQRKFVAERTKLLAQLDVVEKKLSETFSAFHNAREAIEVYQETGRKP